MIYQGPTFFEIRERMFMHLGISDPLQALPKDVRDLVIAARMVVFAEANAETLRALDKASEVFADRVPWEERSGDD